MSREPRFAYFSSEAKRRCTTCEVEIKSVSGACARPIPEHAHPRIRITNVILLAGYLLEWPLQNTKSALYAYADGIGYLFFTCWVLAKAVLKLYLCTWNI